VSDAKRRLLEDLRTSGERVASALGTLPPDELERGRYEGGWNGRQIIAHIASIEWTYPRLIDLARGAPAAARSEAASANPPAGGGSPQILSYNDRQVAKRDGVPAAELIEEFKTNRDATISAVESAPDELFEKEITSAGGVRGPLAQVVRLIAVEHVLGHVRDITGEGA
jgi:hypothetical protein